MGAAKDRPVLIAVIGVAGAIATAFVRPIATSLFHADAPSATASAGALRDDGVTPTPAVGGIEGAWKQYVLLPEEGAVYLGTFVVSKFRGEYVVSPRSQQEGDRYVNTLGVFDVEYTGDRLTFNSNWGGGEVGNFDLQRVSPTMFEGEIRVAGALSNRTRFVKVE